MTYELVATLGPSSSDAAAWAAMLSAGATGFRLNTSHLSLPDLRAWLERLEAFSAGLERRPSLVLDLQGSKWRLGNFRPVELRPGQEVELRLAASVEGGAALPVPHADFFQAAPLSDGRVLVNDAKVMLQVARAGAESVLARVVRGGPVAPRKGITFASTEHRVEAISEKDRAIIALAGNLGLARFAISYVKDAVEMERYHALLPRPAYLIAKLERATAMREAESIAALADAVWVCRGDLGAELGLPGMARAVSQFSQVVRGLPAPALMAGQVLEHMAALPLPTRSEVCYLYDALVQGYRGFVLSDETAIGRYPVESVQAAAMFMDEAYRSA